MELLMEKDPLLVPYKLQRKINDQLQNIGDAMIGGGVDSMEKYNYMLGQARAYQYILQEISNLLEEKEQKENDGNIIDFESGSPKE